MPVTSLSHITFIVSDLDRSAKLWSEGLGAAEVYDSAAKNHSLSSEKFFLLGGVWVALMRGEPASRSYRHVAFHVPEIELPGFEHRLRTLGAEIRPPRPRVKGEGRSLYFYDYDDNLMELHSGTLEERLHAYTHGAP
jgi:fosfomycin resistance protein FosX